jgi:hypothetical protein
MDDQAPGDPRYGSALPGDPPDLTGSPASPAYDDEGTDTAFAPTVRADAAQFGLAKPAAPICQWCNASLPSGDVEVCPSCGVRLKPLEGTPELPGLTTPDVASWAVRAPRAGGSPAAAAPPTSAPGWPAPPTVPSAAVAPPAVPAPPVGRSGGAYEGLTPDEIEALANSSAALRQEISALNSRDALQPPTRDVRQAMLEIEFEADRADPMRIVDPGPLSDRRSPEPPI